jgi:hypothetical protein
MVSTKILLALLPGLALTAAAAALPGSPPSTGSLTVRACYPPTGCTLDGDCEYCCAEDPRGQCHPEHDGEFCPTAGQSRYHCDDEH